MYYDPAQLPSGAHLTANATQNKLPIPRTVDEQADSAARKCIMYFGPGNNPRLSIGARNQVAVDAGGKIHLIDDIDEYRKSVHTGTWNSVNKLADELREKKIKIGFFSSTPQGGECPSLAIPFTTCLRVYIVPHDRVRCTVATPDGPVALPDCSASRYHVITPHCGV